MIFLGFLKLSADESNLGKIMAERGGFEPPVPVAQYDGLANRCLRPLSHLSAGSPIHRIPAFTASANVHMTSGNIPYSSP